MVDRETYHSCLGEMASIKSVFEELTPVIPKLRDIFQSFRSQGVNGLMKSRAAAMLTAKKETKMREELGKKLAVKEKIVELLSSKIHKFLLDFKELLQNYFGVKLDLKGKTSNFAQLAGGLVTVRSGVKSLYETFSLKIKAEDAKVNLSSNSICSIFLGAHPGTSTGGAQKKS